MKVLHAANAYHGTRAAATRLTGASSGPLHYLGRIIATPFVTAAGIGYEIYTAFTPFDGRNSRMLSEVESLNCGMA